MTWENLFSLAGTLALAAWVALIGLPRWALLKSVVRFGVVGLLAILYAALMFVYFFRVKEGGFGSLAQVHALFASEPLLLAGWIHYLAFDLFIGVWIAERLDNLRVSRLVQAPILIATFLFGPLGLLLSFAPQAIGALRSAPHAPAPSASAPSASAFPASAPPALAARPSHSLQT